MPEPQPLPSLPKVRRVAVCALVFGIAIMLMKFGVFWVTDSAAVLADAMESVINLVAAVMMIYSLWLSSRPADKDHPYGHGKVEFMAVGLEGWLILLAGLTIAYEGVRRLIAPPELDMARLSIGSWLIGGVSLLVMALGIYVYSMGRKYDSQVLIAEGKHQLTDAITQGLIQGYHKLRHRHTGAFHWVEMHLQVDGAMTVYDSHELASEIEGRIERALGQGNATAHVEPIEKIVRPS
jgi:divalent metal cation (Fe/Co/Zn/Cd) transporter